MSKKTIAILGCTGHIGKNILLKLINDTEHTLYLFSRSKENISELLKKHHISSNNINIIDYNELLNFNYDVIINCVGFGDPKKVRDSNYQIFQVTERFDNLVLDYLRKINRNCLYINFSSGAAYGTDFIEPATIQSVTDYKINSINAKDSYSVSKFYSEAKHRVLQDYNIVDVRVFGFFSEYIDLNTRFFLSDIINSIIQRSVFQTSPEHMIRDYVHPDDLYQLLILIIEKHNLNLALDLYSKKPISKKEMLNYFSNEYGVEIEFPKEYEENTITGLKPNYYSLYEKAASLGYSPKYSSLEVIVDITQKILNKNVNS
jgi:nucleoside-diphosphate-sugar epimerase